MSRTHVECPNCGVRYPLDRLYADQHDRPSPGKSYTILCSVCGRRFDVTFSRRWPFPLRTKVRSGP